MSRTLKDRLANFLTFLSHSQFINFRVIKPRLTMFKRSAYLFSGITLLLTTTLPFVPKASASAAGVHWEYSGDSGPPNWAKLTPEYGACGTGSNQSPINLTGLIDAQLKPIPFSYVSGRPEILNNGHTIQVNPSAGSSIEVDGIKFELKQFHFHAPSENQINGKSFPLEVHLVHADRDGNLAVVAVMVAEGKANKLLAEAWANIPKTEGEKTTLPAELSPVDILPTHHNYYRFSGSLTTPPCSEGVRWLVMKNSITASKAQIDQFKQVMHHPNNRPIQPIKARLVLE
jgi:carbonic anhydrase